MLHLKFYWLIDTKNVWLQEKAHNIKSKGSWSPSTVDDFRQHLLHLNTSFIAFSMNELRKQTKMTISVREDHKTLKHLILLVIDLWYFWGFSYSSAG